jgi:hypothetical protein
MCLVIFSLNNPLITRVGLHMSFLIGVITRLFYWPSEKKEAFEVALL